MRRFRFHLGTLVIIVLFLGVGLAALRESNANWDTSIFNVTLGMLLISILLAVHRAEKGRAFWLGFALFGSAYLGLSLVPSIEPRLITTKALAYLDSKVPRSSQYFSFYDVGMWDNLVGEDSQPIARFFTEGNGTFEDMTSPAGLNPAGSRAWSSWNSLVGTSLKGSSGTTEHFIRISHSLLAIVAAFLGGQLSRYLYTKNTQGTSGPQVSISNDLAV